MAKALSLKLQESVFTDVEKITHKIRMPRNTYINHALKFYNSLNRRKLLKKQLHRESLLTRNESLAVLAEFERIEDGLPE